MLVIALDCRGNNPFADVFCLNDLSFPSCSRSCQLSVFERVQLQPHIFGHMLIPRSLFVRLHVWHGRTASHLQPSSFFEKLIESISAIQASCDFCITSKRCLRVISLFSFLFALVAEVVVVVVCIAREPLLQSAHRNVAVCIRERTASSSSCVYCSTTRSHLVLAFRADRACCVTHVQNAHWNITVCAREDAASSSKCVFWMTTHSHCHRRASCCPSGDCPQSFVPVFSSSTGLFSHRFAPLLPPVCGI